MPASSQVPRHVGPQRRVLIADDEDRIRHVLTRILQSRGIATDSAADGEQTVAMATSGCYDLIILDLLMPKQNGFTALREIMRRGPY